MDYKEFFELCQSKRSLVPEKFLKQFDKEVRYAERYYNNGRDLFQELKINAPKFKSPMMFALGFSSEIEEKNFELIQVKSGASGGIDIDSDFSGDTKDRVFNYLREKYGKDRVLGVGTYSRLGLKSAFKDLARVFGAGTYEENNKLSSSIPKEVETWEEAVEFFKEHKKDVYDYYLKNKEVFDLLPHFVNKIRQVGRHAGGTVVLDKPVWNYMPVERVQGDLVTAYEESGQKQTLDEVGAVKLDLLG